MITKVRNSPISRLAAVRFRRNPTQSNLLVDSGADPWIVKYRSYYYYCRSINDRSISVNKSKSLLDIGKDTHQVWAAAEGSQLSNEVWAPELHRLNDKWYIYFTAGIGPLHRMYVLESATDDPQGEYILKGKITDDTDKWAIDGTVLEAKNKMYFVWSGWKGDEDGQQNLYIAAMSSPWQIYGKRVCISEPEYSWERKGQPHPYVNEGPEVLKHGKRIFIIYSASHSATDDYCLGQLTYAGGNPLDKNSWIKNSAPVFCKTAQVFAPGHASFVKGPNRSNWIIYHTAKISMAGWDRQVQAQRFIWNKDGSPNFGQPLSVIVH